MSLILMDKWRISNVDVLPDIGALYEELDMAWRKLTIAARLENG
jgi:hypothetical protein